MTYDPRGAGRSERTDGAGESTPEQHADDLHRLISALGAGPVDIFASSGGAVNALALVARHPEQVRTLVAHEPPAAQAAAGPRAGAGRRARTSARRTSATASGRRWPSSSRSSACKGPIPADFADRPRRTRPMFGLPTEDDGSRDDALLGQNIITCTHYEPDFDALRAASTRIVLARRRRVGGRDGPPRRAWPSPSGSARKPSIFPSHHGGFLGGEFGMTGDPDAFAATLREVLTNDR